MSFTGNPGTGKTTVALRMAEILHRLGYVRKGHLVAVTRDDLVGQYIGHTAPKTREVLKRAMGGVLFIDEAYYLYRPENERDYGQEAIEILLQEMENHRDDLVVILAGYKDRMGQFFRSNPGLSSRIAHHIDFPDYTSAELLAIAHLMLKQMQYTLSREAEAALREYIELRQTQPNFSNARSIRNALDRARLRQASRLFAQRDKPLSAQDLMTIEAQDIRASRVFAQAARGSDFMKQMTRFLIEEQRRHKDATGNFTALVNDIRLACKRIATLIGKGALPSWRRHGQCAGETQSARHARERDLHAHERMGRAARRHGLGGDGSAVRDPGGVSARALSAAVRPARRLVERRCECRRRQHLLGAAVSRRRERADRRSFPAGGRSPGVRGLRDLWSVHDARPYDRPRRAWLHARSRDRRVHADASGPAHPGEHLRVRHQRLELALLGSDRSAAT